MANEPESPPPDPAPYAMDGEPPRAARKRRLRRFLGAVLAIQMLIPLTYYLRDDPYDERFAWRMFSAVRLHRCQTSAAETVGGDERGDEREIPLTSVIHRAWVNHLARNRAAVVRAFLRHRCEGEGVTEVQVSNVCVTPDGTTLEPQVYTRDCESGETSEPDALIVEAR